MPTATRRASKNFGSVVGQPRSLAAHEGHVAAMRPTLEAIDDVGQSGTALGEIGRVDLGNVSETYDLGAGPGAGDQRLHLLGGKVLCLIDDQELIDESAPAHEIERFDLDAGADQVAGGRAS